MINKFIKLLLCLFIASCATAQDVQIKNGMSRCDLGLKSGYFSSIRGTGYYWLEYLSDFTNKNNHLVLLIKSEVPSFIDRKEIVEKDLNCSHQIVVDHLRIDDNLIESFDCHILDDMPNPIGEITFGQVDNEKLSGLYNPSKAWRAAIGADGENAEIKEVGADVRVLCTVLPTID